MTTKFQVGRTYSTRSICDHDCIFSFTILSRTAQTVTIQVHNKVVRRKIGLDDHGIEHIMPLGSYSMAPSIGADDPDLSQKAA